MKTKILLLLSILLACAAAWFWPRDNQPMQRTGKPSPHASSISDAHPPPQAHAQFSSAVEAFFRSDSEPFEAQLQTLLTLDNNLSQAECAALFAFLKQPMSPDEVNVTAAVKDEVLHVLRHQANLPAPFHRLLIELFEDKQQHIVTRDYTLQHLAFWREETPASFAHARREMDQVLWKALEENPATTIPGTALMGLRRLAILDPTIDPERVGAAALDLANGALPSRISALQVCASLGLEAVLPIARILAQSGETIPLRASAIAALGELGGTEELVILEALPASENSPLLQPAVNRAIQTLALRIHKEEI
jgi:hypothetical protein